MASLGIWRVLAISMGLALTSKLLAGWRLFTLLASRVGSMVLGSLGRFLNFLIFNFSDPQRG